MCRDVVERSPHLRSIIEDAIGQDVHWRSGHCAEHCVSHPPALDSWTSREEEKTAAEREAYAARLAEVEYGAWDPEVMEDIEAYKLGRIHGCYNPKLVMQRRHRKAGLYVKEAAVHDVEELPQLNGIDDLPLPEVAVCGASNAGKSSLLNALLSADATVGPAAVCSRPGWTRSIQLFKLYETRYEDGLMCLADCPGYGTALASKEDRMQWARTMRDYLRKRQQCTGVFVLIDCSRGVTEDDERFMTLIDSTEKKFHCVLTKADLLTPVQLAQSNVLVAEAATKHSSYAGGDIPMCSANNHAGVAELYRRLRTGLRHFANNRRHTELRNLPNQQLLEEDERINIASLAPVARIQLHLPMNGGTTDTPSTAELLRRMQEAVRKKTS